MLQNWDVWTEHASYEKKENMFTDTPCNNAGRDTDYSDIYFFFRVVFLYLMINQELALRIDSF